MLIAALAFVTAFTAPAAAGIEGWQAEPGMVGTQYVWQLDEGGVLLVNGWRHRGGSYYRPQVKEGLYRPTAYSNDVRIGISTEAVRVDAKGEEVLTIVQFFSYPSVSGTEAVNFECGIGPGFEGPTSETDYIVAIVENAEVSNHKGIDTAGIRAAAKVDLKTGAIVPIDIKGVACVQPLGD